jgi:UDP-N-acetylmuramoyl-tripeptide--D-alanyl-D-alanine ligase
MTPWTVHQVLEATGGQLVRGNPDTRLSGISIDSRRLVPGDAFLAIHGTKFDGHRFLEDAAHNGAACLIVSELPVSTNGSSALPMVLVDDTTQALGHLARYHRRRMGKPIIAITGSCGKTTTKELIAHLIGEPWAVLKTTGTQNNHIGAPLTLLRLEPRHEFGVIELGSNHPGEIAYLASIVEPDVAVVTNVGPVHLEFLGSIMGVLQEKLSLFDALRAEGTAVVPGDQLDVCLEAPRHLKAGVRLVSFGSTDRCDIQAVDVQRGETGMSMRLRDDARQWAIPLVGYHNVENVLAAVACAWALGVPVSAARDRLRSFETVPLRSQVVRCNGLTILNDCYNANPLSFARALETLKTLDTRRRVAIVGDMLELGSYAPTAHQAIGRLATQLGIDRVIAVGEYADDVAQGAREVRPEGVLTCRTVPELLECLPGVLEHGDGLLVKGSRKLNLEQVTDFLLQKYRGVHGEFAQ